MVGQDPRELLQAYEKRWREELQGVSLIAELELTKQDINTALFCIGAVWKREYFADRATAKIKASYPASFVVAVAGSASMHLEGGRVLPEVFKAAGLRDDGGLGRAFGRTFIACLDDLGLPTFQELDNEAAYRYVGRMLLHGGIPLDHLDEWFEVAESARRRIGDVSRQALQAEMVQRADEGRLYGATRAVERFLRYGEDFAADFLDRSLDLLDRVRDGDGVDDIHVGLARRYLERAIELRDAGQLPGASRSPAVRQRGAVRPEVRFDPYVLGVHLVLPSVVADGGTVVWNVTMDGTVERLVARSSRPGLPTAEVEVPVPPSVAHVAVSRPGDDDITVRVVDLDDPHLIFDAAGHRIERTGRLPHDAAWSVHPEQRDLEGEPPGGLHVAERHESVARWPGWVAELVDLRDVAVLRLEGGRPYIVAGEDSAILADAEPIPHVASDAGVAVLSCWPSVRLPPGDHAEWDVSVTDLADASNTQTARFEAGSAGQLLPLDALATDALQWRPVRIRARGPLGRSLRRDVLIAPGLQLDMTPPMRTFGDHGLDGVRAAISWENGSCPPVVLAAGELARAVEICGATLIIEPPAVSVQYIAETTAPWGSRPLLLNSESVEAAPGSLVVRLPGASDASLEVYDAAGRVVQRVAPDGRARRDGARRFDLSRVTETLRSRGSITLRVTSDVWSGLVASVRPARLADKVVVHPDRGVVEFLAVPTDGVRAALYCRHAPTLPPEILDVPRGDHQTSLPKAVVGLGPLRVLLRIDDPWVPEEWPAYPTGGANIFDISDLPADPAALALAHPLAGFLAGYEHLDDLHGRVGDAMVIYDRAHKLDVARTGSAIRAELAPLLHADPDEALVAGLEAGLDGRQLARVLVQSGLMGVQLDKPLDIERVESLWTLWPAAGLLACGDFSDDDLAAFARSRCGPYFDQLLRGEGADVLVRPVVDQPQLLDMDSSLLAMIRAEAGIAPKYLLDPDSRADDGFALVRALQDPSSHDALAPAIRQAESTISYALDVLCPGLGVAAIEDGIRARIQGHGWQLLPAASLAGAVASRLLPRMQERRAGTLRVARDVLGPLVRVLPRLVAADLVMTELTLQGARG